MLLHGVTPVWLTDYWDGPLEGLATYEGRLHWFKVESFDADDPPSVRTYVLYPLSEDEAADEEALHQLFQEHVGTHTDWQLRGTRDARVHQDSNWASFYDSPEAKRHRDYTTRPPTGRFTL